MSRIVKIRRNVNAVESELDGFRSEYHARSQNAKIAAVKLVSERDRFVHACCVKHGLVTSKSAPQEIGRAWKSIAHHWDAGPRKFFDDWSTGHGGDIRVLRSLIDRAEVTYDTRRLSSYVDAEMWMRQHNLQVIKKLVAGGHLRNLNPSVYVASFAYKESKERRELYY